MQEPDRPPRPDQPPEPRTQQPEYCHQGGPDLKTCDTLAVEFFDCGSRCDGGAFFVLFPSLFSCQVWNSSQTVGTCSSCTSQEGARAALMLSQSAIVSKLTRMLNTDLSSLGGDSTGELSAHACFIWTVGSTLRPTWLDRIKRSRILDDARVADSAYRY